MSRQPARAVKSTSRARSERASAASGWSTEVDLGVGAVGFSPKRAQRVEWLALGVILLVGLGLRVGYLAELVHKPDYDAPLSDACYDEYWGRALATGDWTPPVGERDPEIRSAPYFRPPGYPYFLAAIYAVTGHSWLAPRIVQVGLGLASIGLVFWIGRRIFDALTGLLAAALTAVYWGLIYFEGEFQPNALITLLGLLLLVLLGQWASGGRKRWVLAAGGVVGLYAIVRPNVLLFVPVLLVWLAWVAYRRGALRRGVHAAGLLLAGMAAAILPVTVRNAVVGREFALISTNGGVNLYIGNNPQASLVAPRIPDIAAFTGGTGWSLFQWPDIVRGVAEQEGRPMAPGDVSRYFSGRACEFMKAEPAAAARMAGQRWLLLWGPREVSNNKVDDFERDASVVLGWLPGFPVAFAVFFLGLGLCVIRRFWPGAVEGGGALRADGGPTGGGFGAEMTALIVGFVFIYSASFAPFLAAGRYRTPYVPLLLLVGAYAVRQIGAAAAARRYYAAAFMLGGGVLVYAVGRIPLVPYEPDRASWHLDRGYAWSAKGETARALAEYEAAVAASPESPDTHATLARAWAEAGDMDRAIAHARRAAEIAPHAPAFRGGLGMLLHQLGEREEAVAEYRAALELRPQDQPLWYELGRALLEMNRPAEAVPALEQAVALEAGDAQAQINLGIAYLESGNSAEAISAFRRGIQIDPQLFQGYYNLASALWRRGDLDAAMAAMEQAARLEPHSRQIQAALEQIRQARSAPATRPSP